MTEDTVFDRVVSRSAIVTACMLAPSPPLYGTTPTTDSEDIRSYSTVQADIDQLDIMQDAIDAGTATLWYRDSSIWIAYDDLEEQHGLLHTMHSMRQIGAPDGGWRVPQSLVKTTAYSTDDDTGRSDLAAQFGLVPTKRTPDGSTFNYPLDRWNARLVNGTQINFERTFDLDENVTDINAADDVIGMLAWLESLRTTGDAVGDSIASGDVTNSLGSRTYQLDQGTGFPTLDLQFSSSSLLQDGVIYTEAVLSFTRASGETDTIYIDEIRTVLTAATGSITVASDDAPEAPPFGSTEIGVKAAFIELPDGKRIEPLGERVVLRQSSLGRTPMDGSGRRIVRYTDLPDRGTGKAMPKDGSRVVHFGHGAGSSGRLEFLLVSTHTLSENVGEIYEVRNISLLHDCSVYAPGGTFLLINLKPGQQCAFEVE